MNVIHECETARRTGKYQVQGIIYAFSGITETFPVSVCSAFLLIQKI